jgi:hypothetical protein
MRLIRGGDGARSSHGGAGAQGGRSGRGGVSGASTQPVLQLVGVSAGGVGVELRVLGPVEAVVNGGLVDLGPLKQRVLCALLVSRVGRPVAVVHSALGLEPCRRSAGVGAVCGGPPAR